MRRFKLTAAVLPLILPGLLPAADGPLAWAEDLWLGIDGVWSERVEFAVSNNTDTCWTCRTVGISAERLGVEGKRIAELRLVDDSGEAWQCGILSGTNSVDRGNVPHGATVVFPVYLDARAARRFALYWGNPKAWELSDVWRNVPDVGADVVSGIRAAHLDAERRGENVPWPKDMLGGDIFRVPIVVMNLSDEMRDERLASFLLADAIHGENNPELTLMFEGRRVDGARFGTRYVFPVRLAPKSINTYYLYVKPGSGKASASKAAGGGIASEILSDQASLEAVVLTPYEEAVLLRIAGSGLNKLRNAAFEDEKRTIRNWDTFGDEARVEKRIDETGGLVGGRHAVMSVSPGARLAWRWMGQRTAVKPSREYFCGCFTRCEGLTNGKASLHFSEFDAGGKAIKSAAGRSANGVSGTLQWTDLWRIFKTSADTREVEMILSAKSAGRIEMDGAIVAEHADANVGEREYPPGIAVPELAVACHSATEKIFPEKPIKDGCGPWKLFLARNETEDLQLAVRLGRAACVTAEVEPPRNGSGTALPVESLLVGLVPIDTPVSYARSAKPEGMVVFPRHGVPRCDGWRGLWPDPMVRTNGCIVAAGTTRAFRFSVKAGPRSAPGVYRGTISWKTDGRIVRSDQLEVTVWNFSIPERPLFAAGYDMRIPQEMFRAPGELDDEGARSRITALMAEYKIAPTAFPAKNLFSRDAEGRIVADFTDHDAEAEKFFNVYVFPSAYMPRNPFYGFGVAARPKNFLGEEPYEKGETNRSKLRPEYVKAFQTALGMYWRHVKVKGWDKKLVLYISDEPRHWTKDIAVQMKALCKMIHEVDPSIPIYSSTWQFRPEWIGSIDVWGAGSYGCFTLDEMEKVRKAGGRLWFTTDGQMCIDTPYCAVEQMLPLYAAVHGVEKYEFWGAPWVTNDPWRFGWHAYIEGGVRFPNGDGFVIYPPRNPRRDARPCPSIRLAAARDGVELHSYYMLLEKIGGGDGCRAAKAREFLAECRRLCTIPNAGGRRSTALLQGPNVIDDWRFRAGELLNGALLNPSTF